MDRHEEWLDKVLIVDARNRFCSGYQNDDGSLFYIEPHFYTAFTNFNLLFPGNKDRVLKFMDELVRRHGCVVFTGDDEEPLTCVDHLNSAIFLTMPDLADRLNIYIDDISRGSDYGD